MCLSEGNAAVKRQVRETGGVLPSIANLGYAQIKQRRHAF